MNRRMAQRGGRGGKKKSTTRLPQKLVDELGEKKNPTPVQPEKLWGKSNKRKLPVEEEQEPDIPDNRKFAKKFVNKIAGRKEHRKAERRNKKQKRQPQQQSAEKQKPTQNAKPTPKKETNLQKEQPALIKHITKVSSKVMPREDNAEEQDEDRYLRQLEKKLRIKDASKVLKSKLFMEDGLDDLLSGITVGSNKLLGKKPLTENSSGIAESDGGSDEELIEGAHYYSTRNQNEADSDMEDSSEELQDESQDESEDESQNKLEDESEDESQDGSEKDSEEKTKEKVQEEVATKYIPPHMRKTEDKLIKLRRLLQGQINKLNESNIESILTDIDQMYLEHSRNNVTTTLTDLILRSVSEQVNLLDSFVIINATVIAGVYRLVGTESAAHFTQTLVEKLIKHHAKADDKEEDSKICLNLITLVSELYNLGVVSCVLIYSIIRFFLQSLGPLNVELLLKMIRAIGPALRQDDPSAMKEIILLAQKNTQGAKLGVRFKFMMEVMNDLKNNKLKKSSHLATQSALADDTVRRMKTLLKNIEKRRQTINSEPLQVSLDDILSASTKGKWWLVGAAWKGEDPPSVEKVDSLESNDPNSLLTLARQQRMATDLRKRIFTVLMSSEDFADAYERLMKLGLTEKQQRDIPRVLLHCCGNEKTYNSFYTLVASRLNAYRASFKITFQYALWDFLRELGESGVGGLGGSHTSDSGMTQVPVRRIINLGKFFGYLLAKVSLTLTILKSLTFTALKSRTRLFLQLTFIHQLISTDDESITQQVAKLADLKDLRQGLAFFIHHFVATPTDLAASSLSDQERVLVASRAKFIVDLLKS